MDPRSQPGLRQNWARSSVLVSSNRDSGLLTLPMICAVSSSSG